MEGAEVTRSGRLFQTRAAATGKAWSPTVGSRVLKISDEDELEWRPVADGAHLDTGRVELLPDISSEFLLITSELSDILAGSTVICRNYLLTFTDLIILTRIPSFFYFLTL